MPAGMHSYERSVKSATKYKRARSYGKTKQDFVEGAPGRLKRLPVDKGLLRETESVQEVITALVKCDQFFGDEPENDVTLMAFRLLILDLLKLFQVMNEATINVLDAERALAIYKKFAILTERVMKFLSEARSYESATRIEIPKIHHAPTSLATHLEEYLNDPDFDVNRRQYLGTQEAKRTGKPLPNPEKSSTTTSTKPTFPDPSPAPASKPAESAGKGPSPDLIDFFESIEQNQQPMAQNPAQFQQQHFIPQFANSTQQQLPNQQTGFSNFQQQPLIQQSTNPFNQFQQQSPSQQHIQPQATGAGFGGFGPQSQMQTGHAQQNGYQQHQSQSQLPLQFSSQSQQEPQPLQKQSTNPFRQSMMPQATGLPNSTMQSPTPPVPQVPQQTGSNPFAQTIQQPVGSQGFQNFMSQSHLPFAQNSQQQSQPQAPQPIMPQRTGTNPFARASPAQVDSPTHPPTALMPQPTGSTNPFRQSSFVNQQTGTGWQSQQGTMGGLENLETNPIFPRPGQPAQQNQSPWG
ncbi:MAG: hypothetical protein Q9159_001886 [Coniocarpon cinnabarinum]